MHVSGLRISGFRSFAGQADLPVNAGLTGIIGANSSGKSNLLAALRWLFGFSVPETDEHSGDRVRKTEVSAVFEECLGCLPGPLGEAARIELSRHSAQSSDSSFQLNGRAVSYRDVKVMLADARADLPLLIDRSDLLRLIAATPSERCHVLHSAAGVSGLLVRHQDAARKLADSRARMKDVDACIARLSKELDELNARQEAAETGQRLKRESDSLHARILHAEWAAASRESMMAREDCRKRADRDDSYESARTKAAGNAGLTCQSAIEAQDEARRSTIHLAELRLEQARNEGQRSTTQTAVDMHEAEEARLGEAFAREEELLIEARLLNDHADAGLRALSEMPSPDNERAREDALAAVQAAQKEIRSAEAALTTAIGAHDQSLLDNQMLTIQGQRLAALDADIAGIRVEAKREDDDTIHAARSDARQALNLAYGESDLIRQTCSEAEKDVEAARKSRADLAFPLIQQERSVAALVAEIETLEQVGHGSRDDDFNTAFSHLRPKRPGLEKAFFAALGSDIHVPRDQAMPAHWNESGGAVGLYLPDQATPLHELVESPGFLAKRLAQCGLVSADDGPGLQSQLHQGQKLVSKAGDLWRWDGFVRRSVTEPAAIDTPVNSAAMGSQLQDVRRKLQEARTKSDVLRQEIAACDERLREAESRAAGSTRALSDHVTNVMRHREKVVRAEAASTQIRAQHRILEKRRKELESERLTCLKTIDGIKKAAGGADRSEQPAQNLAGQALAAAYASLAQAQKTHNALAHDKSDKTRHATQCADDRHYWSERVRTTSSRIEEITARRGLLARKIAQTKEFLTALDRKASSLATKTSHAEETDKRAEKNARKIRDKLQVTENALTKLSQRAPGKAELDRSEARLEAALGREELIDKAAQAAFGCDASALEAAGGNPADTAATVTEMSQQRTDLEKQRQALPNASEDEKAGIALLKADIKTHVQERQTLAATITRLDNSLAQIGARAHSLLTGMFDKVNAHFSVLYRTLMGGGEAHLELLGASRPDDIGLEITARPPGDHSRTQLHALSENERILTAMALALSIFIVRPAPVGLLDDIDTAFDQTRSERFCKVLRDIGEHTGSRLLLISGNPATIANVDRLLWITMDETGASHIAPVESGVHDDMRVAAA